MPSSDVWSYELDTKSATPMTNGGGYGEDRGPFFALDISDSTRKVHPRSEKDSTICIEGGTPSTTPLISTIERASNPPKNLSYFIPHERSNEFNQV
jgi:hypothetical protein